MTPTLTPTLQYRLAMLLGMVASVPIGLATRFLSIPGWEWLNDLSGSLVYQICLMFLLAGIWPRWSLRPQGRGLVQIAIAATLFSCTVEALQQWHTPWLDGVRATTLGRLILGNTFMWSDFPPYFLGSALGWLVLQGMQRRYLRSTQRSR